ncbi:MAG TPA: cytochrome c3 family protein [Pyrinomonadaceae bacterium]|nr:cytochrome c3 family protein [Pyrinomonadaceae bacterium]
MAQQKKWNRGSTVNTYLTLFGIFLLLVSVSFVIDAASANSLAGTEGRTPQEVYKLSPEAKLGAVTFSHVNHVSKYTIDGTSPIACVHCHHTAQPLAEAVKHPPHKTVWPAERTTTLTTDLFEKDANAPPVNSCRECHARVNEKPAVLASIPQLKLEGDAEAVSLTNQQAFHRNCGGCHDDVVKKRSDATAPTSKKCTACHKKASAY